MRNFKQFLKEEDLDSFFIKPHQITNGKFNQSLLPFPNKVDDFYVNGSFDNQIPLTSLEGCPSIVDDIFSCEWTHITSLKYGPEKVTTFLCSGCKHLTSLEYGPSEVSKNYYADYSSITSLEGMPKKLTGSFYCQGTKITSLAHAPLIVGKDVMCNNNIIKSFEGIGRKYLKEIGDQFWIPDTIESHILGICTINKLQHLICMSNIHFKPVLDIVKKHLQTDGEECAEELIQNGYKDYARF